MVEDVKRIISVMYEFLCKLFRIVIPSVVSTGALAGLGAVFGAAFGPGGSAAGAAIGAIVGLIIVSLWYCFS